VWVSSPNPGRKFYNYRLFKSMKQRKCEGKTGFTLWDPCLLLNSHRCTHRLVGPFRMGMLHLPFLSSLLCVRGRATAALCACLSLLPGLLVSPSPWIDPPFLERKTETDTGHGPELVPHGGKKSRTHLSSVIRPFPLKC